MPNKKGSVKARVRRNALLFFTIAIVWILFDRATKAFFDSGSYQVGEYIGKPIMGLFRFQLVHNTGAAWGIFNSSTVALAILSLAVCVFILLFVFFIDRNVNTGCIVGLSLVFAGGIGNAIDRFIFGYVVDFIDFAFISFPVFNIADIGVTCGVVIFLVSYIVYIKNESSEEEQ